jgi:regulator of protease activity HflC (stomatin/prohibitin superfamily)
LKARDKINALLRKNVLEVTTPWGVAVELLEMKDVEIPQDMQRVMAMEAEAMREASPYHQSGSGTGGFDEAGSRGATDGG